MGWKYEPDAPNHIQVQPPPQIQIIPPPPQPQYMYAPPQQAPAPQDPITTVVGLMTAVEQMKKIFKEDKKDDKKEDEKKKPKPLITERFTNFNRADIVALSFILLATSPWTGYWITVKLFEKLGEWSTLLQHIPK